MSMSPGVGWWPRVHASPSLRKDCESKSKALPMAASKIVKESYEKKKGQTLAKDSGKGE